MIPDELLFKIIEYLSDNNTCINLVLSCRYFKNTLYNHGYLKFIKITPMYNSPDNFLIQTGKHRRTLNSICLMYLHEAQWWIGEWPKTVFFNYCTTGKIDPGREVYTENLIILNDRSKKLSINWKKFPKLKKFRTTSWSFNHEDISNKSLCVEV